MTFGAFFLLNPEILAILAWWGGVFRPPPERIQAKPSDQKHEKRKERRTDKNIMPRLRREALKR